MYYTCFSFNAVGYYLSSSKNSFPFFDFCAPLADPGSCEFPIQLEPPESLVLNPCPPFWDSTASSSSDVVMSVGPYDASKNLTVVTSRQNTKLYVFTECPDEDSSSRVSPSRLVLKQSSGPAFSVYSGV